MIPSDVQRYRLRHSISEGESKTLHLSDPFDAHSYIDLYKEVSRFKFLFALTSYKQKSIELFLGIDRIDAYSGGELIEVYKEYVRHPAKDSLALLKQHNYEDVLYMPKLLPVLSYPKLWEQAFSLQSLQASEYRSMDGASGNKELFFTLALQYPVPKPVSFSYDDCYLSMSGSTARLRVRLFEGELRFFYDGQSQRLLLSPRGGYRSSQEHCFCCRQGTPRTGKRFQLLRQKICHLSSAV